MAEVTLLYIEMKTRYLILKAADFINVTGKKILVIGSQAPWVEAILLTRSPEKIVTVEYGHFKR